MWVNCVQSLKCTFNMFMQLYYNFCIIFLTIPKSTFICICVRMFVWLMKASLRELFLIPVLFQCNDKKFILFHSNPERHNSASVHRWNNPECPLCLSNAYINLWCNRLAVNNHSRAFVVMTITCDFFPHAHYDNQALLTFRERFRSTTPLYKYYKSMHTFIAS